jgi:methionyl-tRNA formyltransferase
MNGAPLRLAFMGSPEFAVPALRALHHAGHHIAAVYAQPPRPAGRGQTTRPCAVHAAAEALGIPVRTPARLRQAPDLARDFAALALDGAVVAAYGLILPPEMLHAPRLGCLNIHASLLPRWRGAAPIQAAIMAGDTQTGITIMRMEAGLDTGPMLLREAVPITRTSTTPQLHDALAELGARLILRALAENPPPVPQPPHGVTLAPKLSRADAVIDWSLPAEQILRQVRALNPWPGTETRLDGQTIKIRAAVDAPGNGPPGTVLDEQLTIACGVGAIRPTMVQAASRGAMSAEAFLRGHGIGRGAMAG